MSWDKTVKLWDYNTLREFETVSGETARGGSMSGSGATVANGMLYMNSGYGIYEHMPGNVLLAFGVRREQAPSTADSSD